ERTDAREVLRILGDEALLHLRRLQVVHLPDTVLTGQIAMRARQLAGESQAVRLRDFLFRRVPEAAPSRATLDVGDLIAEARRDGIPLQAPPVSETPDLRAPAAHTLVILQACSTPLPLEVVAA